MYETETQLELTLDELTQVENLLASEGVPNERIREAVQAVKKLLRTED